MKFFARFFLALFLLQTLLATPVQAGLSEFSASNLPPAPIQRAQPAINSGVIRFTDWSQLKVNPGTLSAKDLALNLSGTFTTKGAFEIAGDLSIAAAKGIDNSGAALKAGGELALYGGGLNNKNGTIEAGSLWADLDGDLNNDQGRITATRDAWIMAAGNIHATQGSFTSKEGDFILGADGNIDLIAAKVSATQGLASVSAGGVFCFQWQ